MYPPSPSDHPAPAARPWTGPGLWLTGAVLLAGAAWLAVFKLRGQPPLIDFLTMWTGGRMADADPARLYDPGAVDRAQAWLLGPLAHERPFPYPPSTLPLFSLLGRLPFWIAGWAWMAAGVGAFALVCARLTPRRPFAAAILALLTPGVVWAALSGQCAFLVGALAVGGVILLERRPVAAGLLLGLAGVFKPSVLLLAPVALVAGGHWRALAGALAGGLALIALAIVGHGVAPWRAWLAMSPGYLEAITHNPRFYTSIVTPLGLAMQLGLRGGGMALWRGAFAVLGAALAVLVFRRTRAVAPRLAALIGASLLASPYAMNYETTLLAPGAVHALLAATDRRSWRLAFLAFAALAVAGLPQVSAAGLMVFLALSLGPTLLAHGARPA